MKSVEAWEVAWWRFAEHPATPQSTTRLVFSYHRPFVMISATEAETCAHPAAVFHTHSLTRLLSRGGTVKKPSSSKQRCNPHVGWSRLPRAFRSCSALPGACALGGAGIGLSVLPWETLGAGIVTSARRSCLYVLCLRLSCVMGRTGLSISSASRGGCTWWRAVQSQGSSRWLNAFWLWTEENEPFEQRNTQETCWLRNPLWSTVDWSDANPVSRRVTELVLHTGWRNFILYF